jgi:predicted nucleic acid-binding protein
MGEAVLEFGALAPMLWNWEIRNVLLVAERRGRLPSAQTKDILDDLARMPITLEPPAADQTDVALARRYGLSVYDAAYLELAVRSGLRLMTRDDQLARAAQDLDLRWDS